MKAASPWSSSKPPKPLPVLGGRVYPAGLWGEGLILPRLCVEVLLAPRESLLMVLLPMPLPGGPPRRGSSSS